MKFDLSNIQLSKNDIRRGLILPECPSPELAEFIGILVGDGYMNYYPYQHKYLLEIAGDSALDKGYLESYVLSLIERLFNIKPSIVKRKNQNTMYLRLISKGLINYLIMLGFPRGRKQQITIQGWILSKREYMLNFLRGFADTDGCIKFRKDYPIIALTSKSRLLITSIFDFLLSESFSLKSFYVDNSVFRIYLNGHRNLKLWLDLVSFRNTRHIKKIRKNGNAGI